MRLFMTMSRNLGPSHWWPGETPFEIAVGAILTQNTSWKNVERTMTVLKEHDLLAPQRLAELPEEHLARLLRPSGAFRVKAKRLLAFLNFLYAECRYDLNLLAQKSPEELRPKLLAVSGIGPETADCILLYALSKPVFVIDAYTRRILSRHGMCSEKSDYETLRAYFEDRLPRSVELYNEFHALFVRTGHHYCRKKTPLCAACPLGPLRH